MPVNYDFVSVMQNLVQQLSNIYTTLKNAGSA